MHSVVLDSELLPTGTPDSASLRVDVRLVKIDTQVALRHEPTYANAITLAAGSTPPAYFPPSPYPLYRAAGERAARAIRIAPHSPHTWRPLIFFENNQMGAASLAAVEAMLSTAPLNYICTRGLQDTLCVHAERRQQRNVGTNLNLTRLNLLRGDRRAPGDADNRPLSRGSSELNHNISQRVKYIRNASRRECLRAPERGTVGGGKNVRRAAAWLGLQAVPRCSLRADQAWAVRVGLLEREVTESDVAMACDGRATAPRASQDGADRARGVKEGQ